MIFHYLNPSVRPVVRGSTHPLTAMSARDIRGEGDQNAGLTTLQPPCVDRLEILGALTSWKPMGPFRPVQGLLDLDILQGRMVTIGRMISM